MGFNPFTAIAPLVNLGGSIYATERNRSASNAQRDWEERMWKMNNEYNTPANQKQRLIDAGLNPALMYETMPQNTSQAPSGGSSWKAEAPRLDAQDFMLGAQLENMNAQTEATRMATERQRFDLERARIDAPLNTLGKEYDNTGKATQNDIQAIERQYREQSLILKSKGLDLSNQQTQKFIEQMSPRFKADMSKMYAEIEAIRQGIETSKTQANLNNHQSRLFRSAYDLNRSSEALNEIKTVVERYEANARRSGYSYSDSILFRQMADIIMGTANKSRDRTGVGHKDNQNVLDAISTVMRKFF